MTVKKVRSHKTPNKIISTVNNFMVLYFVFFFGIWKYIYEQWQYDVISFSKNSMKAKLNVLYANSMISSVAWLTRRLLNRACAQGCLRAYQLGSVLLFFIFRSQFIVLYAVNEYHHHHHRIHELTRKHLFERTNDNGWRFLFFCYDMPFVQK